MDGWLAGLSRSGVEWSRGFDKHLALKRVSQVKPLKLLSITQLNSTDSH